METSKLLRHLKNYQKENPLADVLSLGIYDIDFFNDDLDDKLNFSKEWLDFRTKNFGDKPMKAHRRRCKLQ